MSLFHQYEIGISWTRIYSKKNLIFNILTLSGCNKMTKEVSMLGKLIIKDGKTGLAAPLVSKLSDDVKTQGNAVRYE